MKKTGCRFGWTVCSHHDSKSFLAFLIFAATLIFSGTAHGDAGSYSLTFKASDPTTYSRPMPSSVTCPSGGRGSSPIVGADYGTSVTSLNPQDLGLGQIVPFQMRVKVTGSTS